MEWNTTCLWSYIFNFETSLLLYIHKFISVTCEIKFNRRPTSWETPMVIGKPTYYLLAQNYAPICMAIYYLSAQYYAPVCMASESRFSISQKLW